MARGLPPAIEQSSPGKADVLAAMKRATQFMVDKVAYRGGYVWSYLPDLSRRWGELEARDTMIWIQPPGTATMGHLFLDALHATGDEYYYQVAEQTAAALIAGQHPSGGWNYLVDFAGEPSLADWYGTIGRNAWRLEEFQYHYGNATFDDAGTAEAAKLLLRLYLEKRDAKYKPALDKAIGFVLDSQYPMGAWPQRFPRTEPVSLHGLPDYTAYPTFNDDVAAENIDFLTMCYQAFGDERVLDAIRRGMNAFIVTQQPQPQPGWALQYTPDLKPAGARSYEPRALVTHTTARNLELLVQFYTLTGETKFLARIPEALDWLESLRLPAGVAPAGRTHPTFIEIGTNKPLYVHRQGSNVVNGRYFVDNNPHDTVGHYSSFRRVDVDALRRLYAEAKALSPNEATKGSPLMRGTGHQQGLPRYFAVAPPENGTSAERAIASLTEQGAWIAPLGMNSHPYRPDGARSAAPGDYPQTYVGDDSDTSPYPDETIIGISTRTYIQNMSALIRALDNQLMQAPSPAEKAPPSIQLWPEGVPGAKPPGGGERMVDGRVYNVHVPTLTHVAPSAGTAVGTAVIVCPGGGYGRLAIANEADGVTPHLTKLGVSVFVLRYRLAEYGHPAPLQDVLRAVRLVRARAPEYGVRPDRIGVLGASAGGHLAAAAATLHDAPEGQTGAPLDDTSARPDFIALLYPVITMKLPLAHRDSRRNLLGEEPSADLVERLSLETQVTKAMPPTFLVHTTEDASVPIEHSLLFVAALRRAGVPAEAHLYERGDHGFGVTPGLGPTSSWPDRLADWMRAHGWLDKAGTSSRDK